ncbi:epimerase [Candidatus Woesearchaeota archaeon]|nr:MAG: epimerase [Candidatus Woesearchaeota archaeon]
METVLVTGGAGFIGSHLAECLLKKGKRVVVVDNLDSYYDPAQKKNNIKILEAYPGFKFYKQDIRDFNGLARVFERHKIDKIAHLAAKCGVRASLQNPKEYEEVNVGGTLNLLELAKAHKVKCFVFGSSSSVYGVRTKAPFKEEDLVDKPISPYAASKRSAELFCYVYATLYKLNVICLRFFTVYGPRGRPDMAPYKFTQLILAGEPITRYGDGSSKRDYTYVSDIVAGVEAALQKQLGFEIINLGNSTPVTLNEFIATLERVTGKRAKIVEQPMPKADVPLTCADITKAKRLLNFKPTTSLDKGLKLFVEWYTKNK